MPGHPKIAFKNDEFYMEQESSSSFIWSKTMLRFGCFDFGKWELTDCCWDVKILSAKVCYKKYTEYCRGYINLFMLYNCHNDSSFWSIFSFTNSYNYVIHKEKYVTNGVIADVLVKELCKVIAQRKTQTIFTFFLLWLFLF